VWPPSARELKSQKEFGLFPRTPNPQVCKLLAYEHLVFEDAAWVWAAFAPPSILPRVAMILSLCASDAGGGAE